MLRNMHVAELRRAVRNPATALSVIEYDSAFWGLPRANDEFHLTQMQDQLRTVCDYACARKEAVCCCFVSFTAITQARLLESPQ